MAKGPDGSIWLAYVDYQPEQPRPLGDVGPEDFDSSSPTKNGDQILLRRFDGKAWQPAIDVTGAAAGRLAADRGRRRPGGRLGRLGPAGRRQLGDLPPPLHPARAGNGAGTWSDDRPRHQRARGPTSTSSPRPTRQGPSGSPGKAGARTTTRSWSPPRRRGTPERAAGRSPTARPTTGARPSPPTARGTSTSPGTPTTRATTTSGSATSPATSRPVDRRRLVPVRGPAPPGLRQDGRVWIAYEEGDEQWGKDFAHAGNVNERRAEEEPRLRALRQPDGQGEVPGRRQAEAAGRRARAACSSELGDRDKSVPRLAVDDAGGVWLLLRHHPLAGAAGEVWVSSATRYDGQTLVAAAPAGGLVQPDR